MIEDVYCIMLSFLEPIEILRNNRISKIYNMWTNKYIRRTFGTKEGLIEKICPMCGNIYTDYDKNVVMFNDFKEVYDQYEEDYRHRRIQQFFGSKYNVRRSILCNSCESIENSYHDRLLPYKGHRPFKVIMFYSHIRSWAIVYEEDKDCTYWNEFYLTIPTSS